MATSDGDTKQIRDFGKSALQVLQDAVINNLLSIFPHIPVGTVRESVLRQSHFLMDPLDEIRLTNNCIDELLVPVISPTTAAASSMDFVDLTEDSPIDLSKVHTEETGCCAAFELDDAKTKTDLKLLGSAPQVNQGEELFYIPLTDTQAPCFDVKSSRPSTKTCDPVPTNCDGFTDSWVATKKTDALSSTTETSNQAAKSESKQDFPSKSESSLDGDDTVTVLCNEAFIDLTVVPPREGKQDQSNVPSKASSTISKCPCKDCSCRSVYQLPQYLPETKGVMQATSCASSSSPRQVEGQPDCMKNNFPNSSADVAHSTPDVIYLNDSPCGSRNDQGECTALEPTSIQRSQTETLDNTCTSNRQDINSCGDETTDILIARLESVNAALIRLSQRYMTKHKPSEPCSSMPVPGMATYSTASSVSSAASPACTSAGANSSPKHESSLPGHSAQSPKLDSSSRAVPTGGSTAAHASSSNVNTYTNTAAKSNQTCTQRLYKRPTADQKMARNVQNQSQPAVQPAVQPASVLVPRRAPHIQPSLGIAQNNKSLASESQPKESKPRASLYDPIPRDTQQTGTPSQQRPSGPPLGDYRTPTANQTYTPGTSKKSEQGMAYHDAQQKNFSSTKMSAAQKPFGHTVTEGAACSGANLSTNRTAKLTTGTPQTATSSVSNTPSSISKQGAIQRHSVQRAVGTGNMQEQNMKNATQSTCDKQAPAKLRNDRASPLPTAKRQIAPTSVPQQTAPSATDLTQHSVIMEPQIMPTPNSGGQIPPRYLPSASSHPGLEQATMPVTQAVGEQSKMLFVGQNPLAHVARSAGPQSSASRTLPADGETSSVQLPGQKPVQSWPSGMQPPPQLFVPGPQPTPVGQPVPHPPPPGIIQEQPRQFPGQGGDTGNEKSIEQLKTEVLMLFPDVDPAYILTRLEAVENYPSPINEVCIHLLENPNYPRVKKDEPKQPSVKKTWENFDFVKDYFKLPPCKDWGPTFFQLQNDFRMLSVDSIRAVCTLHAFHYAPTRVCLEEIMCNNDKICQLLPKVKSSTYEQRKITVEITTKDTRGKDVKSNVRIQVLKGRRIACYTTPHADLPDQMKQEMKSYEDYMKNSALEKDRLLAWMMNENEYEAEGQLIECGCCYTEVSFEKMVQCLDGHLFCESCLQRYAKEAVYGEGKAMLMCMTTGCDSSYPRDQLEKCLSATDMAKYDERVREESIQLASMDGLVRCPHCDFAAVLDAGTKVFSCQNTGCMKETCRHCGEDWKEHFGKRCEEIEKKSETNMRTSYEERMSQAQIRTCHKCKTGIMKDQGCNKMTCRCCAKMCYICRKPNIDYNHFCSHVRNPGEGCTICSKCSLWTDPAEDDARAIKELEKELQQEKEKLARAQDSRSRLDPPEYAPEAKKQKVV